MGFQFGPMRPPVGAIASNATGKTKIDQQDDTCKAGEPDPTIETNSTSIAAVGIHHEDIAIPGTDLTLHYASNRVPDL